MQATRRWTYAIDLVPKILLLANCVSENLLSKYSGVYLVGTAPTKQRLRKFENFCGTSKRTL